MKISSVSKKVLASALSAAMVVAFAPTVAFGATQTATAKITVSTHTGTGKIVEYGASFFDVTGTTGLASALGYLNDGKAIPTVVGQDKDGKDIEGYIYLKSSTTAAVYDPTGTGVTFASDTNGVKAGTYSETILSVDGIELGLLANAEGNYTYRGGFDVILNLGGNTLTNATEYGTDAQQTAAELDTLTITGNGDVTVKNGTVTALTDKDNDIYPAKSSLVQTTGTAEVSVDGATFGTAVSADIDEVKSGAFEAALTDADGFTAKGGTFKSIAITANNKGVDVAKGAVVTAESISTSATGGYVQLAEGAKLTVSKAAKTGEATAIKAAVTVGKNAVLVAEAATTGDTVTGVAGDSVYGKYTKYGKTYTQINDANAKAMPGKTYYENNTGTKAEGLTASIIDVASVNAIAIDGALTATAEGASVTAKASTAGAVVDKDHDTGNAIAVNGAVKMGAKASLAATADAADADAAAWGIKTGVTNVADANAADILQGSVEVKANGGTAKQSFAIEGAVKGIAGGTYDGLLKGLRGTAEATKHITGGSFSDDPTSYVDTANYYVDDDGKYWTVSKAKFDGIVTLNTKSVATIQEGVSTTVSDNAAVVNTFIKNYLEAIAAGKATSGVVLAEGVTEADILAQAKKTDSTKLNANFSKVTYNAKKATEAEKAAFDAFAEFAKADLSKITDATVAFVSLTLQYTNTDGDVVTMATITDLGTTTSGRTEKDNAIVLKLGTDKTTVLTYNGAVAKAGYLKNDYDEIVDVDTATDKTQYGVAFRAIPTAVAVEATDEEALKDAAINGQQPDTPAAEKATQSIDVAKKSLTVKLGAKKTKTAKAKAFKMGASAETELTTAWKSGSTKITVSGDKVKLAKGAKRGTYTAKVSIKAAASAEYLAAASTITVKFVIK